MRRLPSEAVLPDDFEADDEPVDLPMQRSRLALFGIGVGVGLAVLAVVAGLYLGGFVGGPTLNASQPPAPLEPNPALDQALSEQALALARVADRNLGLAAMKPADMPDLPKAEEDVRSPHPVPTPAPRAPVPRESKPLEAPAPGPGGAPAPILQQPELPPPPVAPPVDTAPLPAPAKPTAPAETAPHSGSENPY